MIAFSMTMVVSLMACNGSVSGSQPEDSTNMNSTPTGSRPPPPVVEPVEHDGVRYQEDKTYSEDGDQNGGYLAAFDADSGEKLWRMKVYEVPSYESEGVDNLGLHFKSMKILPETGEMEIVNEVGSRYRVSLENRTSEFIDGPPPGPADDSDEVTPPPPPPPGSGD